MAVANIINMWGWSVNLIHSDYGEDLECNIFESERRTNFYVRIQVKSSSIPDGVNRYANGDYRVKVSGALCHQWLGEYFPTIITVHDTLSGTTHWYDPVAILRATPRALSRKYVAFRVGASTNLAEAKGEILTLVESNYARLLRLENPVMRCRLFPVLMPRYRSEPPTDAFLPRSVRDSLLTIEDKACDVDALPAWFTAVRAFMPHFVRTREISGTCSNIAEFLNAIRNLIGAAQKPILPTEWISFIVTPIRLEARVSQRTESDVFQNQITDFYVESTICDRIVDDRRYAFPRLNGFAQVVERRARSWPGEFQVSREADIAVEFLAGRDAGPAERAKAEIFKANIHAQLVPWVCDRDSIGLLLKSLAQIELTFHETPGVACHNGDVVGVIAPVFTNPLLGVFNMAMNWGELEAGSTRTKLVQAQLLDRLPGREGPPESWKVLDELFSRSTDTPADELLISPSGYRRGLPLNHQLRVVVVTRFSRSQVNMNAVARSAIAELAKTILPHGEVLNVDSQPFESVLGTPVPRLSISVRPALEFSSAECFDAIAPKILPFMDGVLAKASERETDSYSAIHLEGELGFDDESS
jgi:hypothetical protein